MAEAVLNPKALQIPREALVRRLEEVRQEHRDKREEAERKVAEQRKTLLDLVDSLTTDQVANMLQHYVNSYESELSSWLEEVVEKEKFKTLPIEATGVETALDRTIRALKLASNQEIEIEPTDPIYSYL